MKALIIISGCLALAFVLTVIEKLRILNDKDKIDYHKLSD